MGVIALFVARELQSAAALKLRRFDGPSHHLLANALVAPSFGNVNGLDLTIVLSGTFVGRIAQFRVNIL